MIWVSIIVSTAFVFAVAAGTVGAVSAGLAERPRRAVYDVESAVVFIAETLPADVTAQISYDDVEMVINWRIEHLMTNGLASERTDDSGSTELVVLSDDEALAYVLAQCDAMDNEITDEHVAAIFAADDSYRRSIGAMRERG